MKEGLARGFSKIFGKVFIRCCDGRFAGVKGRFMQEVFYLFYLSVTFICGVFVGLANQTIALSLNVGLNGKLL